MKCRVKLFCLCVAIVGSQIFASTNNVAVVEARTQQLPDRKSVNQCWACTKSGNRCKRRAAIGERYCKQHSASAQLRNTSGKCCSMTSEGKRCKNMTLPSKNYCADHLK